MEPTPSPPREAIVIIPGEPIMFAKLDDRGVVTEVLLSKRGKETLAEFELRVSQYSLGRRGRA